MLPLHPPRHDRVRVAGGLILKTAGKPTAYYSSYVDARGRLHKVSGGVMPGNGVRPLTERDRAGNALPAWDEGRRRGA